MKVCIREEGNKVTVEVDGFLNFESPKPFAAALVEIYTKNPKARVFINLGTLSFVGSSGISNFVKAVRDFNAHVPQPIYSGLRPEFIKMFRLFEGPRPFLFNEDRGPALSSL
jgi:anti-sigma B factor antagonist